MVARKSPRQDTHVPSRRDLRRGDLTHSWQRRADSRSRKRRSKTLVRGAGHYALRLGWIGDWNWIRKAVEPFGRVAMHGFDLGVAEL
jgi:hypothetical protein